LIRIVKNILKLASKAIKEAQKKSLELGIPNVPKEFQRKESTHEC
jgi:hypothetical protein